MIDIFQVILRESATWTDFTWGKQVFEGLWLYNIFRVDERYKYLDLGNTMILEQDKLGKSTPRLHRETEERNTKGKEKALKAAGEKRQGTYPRAANDLQMVNNLQKGQKLTKGQQMTSQQE